MSLTNPNKPVTEARLQEFYQQIKPYLGLREMPSGDMSEIVSPKPVTAKGGHRYSTEEQIVGTWIDGSTLYEKTVQFTVPNATTEGTAATATVDVADNLDVAWVSEITSQGVLMSNMGIANTGTSANPSYILKGIRAYIGGSPKKLYVQNNFPTWNGVTYHATIRYTKTT